MKIYGFRGHAKNLLPPAVIVENLLQQGALGMYVIDPEPDDTLLPLADAVRSANMDFILGMSEDPRHPNVDRIARAKRITNILAIGTNHRCEWGMTQWNKSLSSMANMHLNMADKFSYVWVCCLTYESILLDMRQGGKLQRALGQTLCTCLAGYILAAYLYADNRIPYNPKTCLLGQNLHARYGLTIEGLRDYLAPMNVLSGGARQRGLNVGTYVYAQKLGFKGLVIKVPFDLEGADKIKTNDAPTQYPTKLGVEPKQGGSDA